MWSVKPAWAIFPAAIAATCGRSNAVARSSPYSLQSSMSYAPDPLPMSRTAKVTEIDGFAELARGHRGERMHRFPEECQHRRILAVEHRGLRRRVPRGWPI